MPWETRSQPEPIAARIADGRYEVRDLPLWVAGPWQVEIGLLIDDFTKKLLRTELTLAR